MARLSDVEVFAAVVRARGFSAAARELGLTQSAVSRRVAGLEARLGVGLLVRTSRGIRLTDAGQTLHAAADRALADLDAAERAVAANAGKPAGTLRIHLPPAFGRRWIVPIVARFAALHPSLVLHVTLGDRVADLAAARGDVAVRIGALREAGLIARKLGESRPVACAAPAYLARRAAVRRPADLAEHDALVLAIYAPRDRWVFEGARGRQSVKPRARFVSNDVEALLEAARAGLGVALLPEFVAADDLAAGTLVPLLARHRLPAAPIHVVWPDRRNVSRAARAFIDFLVAEFARR